MYQADHKMLPRRAGSRGPLKQYPEVIMVRAAPGTRARISQASAEVESAGEFIRAAIEREIERRK